MNIGKLLPVAALATATLGGAAFAQQPAAPAAAPAAPPPWQQGRPAELENSPLHPHAPQILPTAGKDIPVNKLKVPPGFKVELWAEGVPDARSLAVGSKGTVFVGNRLRTEVYAIVDQGGKREVKTIAKGLNAPNGVLFSKGALFVAERERILRYDDIENHLDNPPAAKVIVDGLPVQTNHFWKYMAMGPDGWIYFNIGSPLNIVEPAYSQASIQRVNPDTGIQQSYATGVRNSVGMAFRPGTKELWFTDNQRDWLGEDSPSDELNRATAAGEHFGYPYCHQGDTLDPQYGKHRSCADYVAPVVKLGPHTAPLGVKFYTGKAFPAEYQNNLFLTEHGSWNKTQKLGFNVVRVSIGAKGEVLKSEPFLTGFLENNEFWGRPVDLLVMPDGAMLLSDDWNGAIYRISYKKA